MLIYNGCKVVYLSFNDVIEVFKEMPFAKIGLAQLTLEAVDKKALVEADIIIFVDNRPESETFESKKIIKHNL